MKPFGMSKEEWAKIQGYTPWQRKCAIKKFKVGPKLTLYDKEVAVRRVAAARNTTNEAEVFAWMIVMYIGVPLAAAGIVLWAFGKLNGAW